MKKIIFILSIFLIHAVELSAQIVDKPIKIRIEVFIASRRSGCTSGIGLCDGSISVVSEGKIRSTSTDVETDGKNLVINFLKSNMNPQLYTELSGTTLFPIEEDYALSPEQSKALGFSKPIYIARGSYRLVPEETGYMITTTYK
jgi:hypothetical protein